MRRKSGILMHISSLFGGYSIGAFSDAAKYFVDFLADSGFSYWQVLPFCVTDEYNSPYSSYSSFGANPYFIDIEELNKRGLVTDSELSEAREHTPYLCEYDRLSRERVALLRRAAKRVGEREPAVSFCASHPNIGAAAEFMALKTKNQNRPWWLWSDKVPDCDELFAWQFIQHEFFGQWEKIKSYANSRGISVVGDLPMYASRDSADVWSAPEEYLLAEDNVPLCVAGVPPDYFSESGQLWNNPIYDWNKMRERGYSTWRARIRHALSMFDGVRIDHFRAFESYWSVPFGAADAKAGSWCAGPGRAIIDAIKEEAGDKLVIAEDLGDITERVVALRRYSGFVGMRVLQFGFLGDSSSIHLPHFYENNAVAYTGTHDNPTLLGYLYEAPPAIRANIASYFSADNCDIKELCERIIRGMLSSVAGLAVFPVQDLLGFGNDTRMNTPGTAKNNWAYRITKAQLDSVDRAKWHYYNKLFGRV